MSARVIRVAFTRQELVGLIYALEDLMEGYSRHDYHLIEDEDKLHQRLEAILRRHDLGRRALTPFPAASGGSPRA